MSDREILVYLKETLGKILSIVEKQNVKEWYSIKEASKILDRSEWTLRNDWIKNRKIAAKKSNNGKEWRIANSEILRIQSDGPSHPTSV